MEFFHPGKNYPENLQVVMNIFKKQSGLKLPI